MTSLLDLITESVESSITNCESCQTKLDPKQTQYLSKVQIGVTDFIFIECHKCFRLNKFELKLKGRDQ